MTFGAAALCAAVSFADVESANVVGYQTVEIPKQALTMIGVPFADVDGQDISVQDLFKDPLGQGLKGALTAGSADQLQYWDPNEGGNYIALYLFDAGSSTRTAQIAKHNQWCVGGNYKDKSWGTYNNPSIKKLTSGMGLWLKRTDTNGVLNLTMAGGVVVAPEGRTYTCRAGLTMIAGGFTTGWAPNVIQSDTGDTNVDWLGQGCTGALTAGSADQLQYWDPNEGGNYIALYLFDAGTSTRSAQIAKHNLWCVGGNYKDKTWGTYNNPCTKVIPAGRGVWYKHIGTEPCTFTLPQPYTLGD